MARYCVFIFFSVTILLSTLTCQELDENESIDVSRIKREGVPENRDLTVLLVNDQNRNDYNTKIGRYHSVKPLIGLLTSTARTFIQDGVTTEFATQILGTTLDNGRIYAQLLTKSSLVLYNKPSNVDDPIIVNPTRVHSAFDGEWNVKQDLGIIDPDKFILKNTDYLAPSSKMEIVYASKPVLESFNFWNPPRPLDYQSENQIYDEPSARKAQSYDNEPKFEVYNFLDGPAIESEKKTKTQPNILIDSQYRQSKAYEPVTEPFQVDSTIREDALNESNIVKVKPGYDLPTFTIKNEFSPIFYYIDNVESRRSPQQPLPQTKLPKKLFGHKSEPRPKKTFTYAGFADFTTVVGDTVIIFTPNTETVRPPNPDEVNVFPSAKPVDKLATKITFLSADIPVATSTFKAHEVNTMTKLPSTSSDENRSEKALYNDEESLKKVLYEVDDKIPDTVSVQYNNEFELNLDVIQPSEPAFTTTESTVYTEDLEEKPVKEFNFKATDSLDFLAPSVTTRLGDEESKESVVTEDNVRQVFTNSEEETENTAAEVTEKVQEEEEEEVPEDESTQEVDTDVQTTTESGHSDESYEIETTTENKYNKHEEVYCSNGLETQSTMTTEYKTLTYLTTYFIPLESTETTTSIKSDVVVESNVGYITNYVCQTDLIIEPTSVLPTEATNTERRNVEQPEVVSQSDINSPKETESITENPAKTTLPMEKDDLINIQDQEDKPTDTNQNSEIIIPQSDSSPSTTTERLSTSQSHIEVSVSTEHTPTESSSSEEEDAENEIDLIYKTLYTTYTYFTTFFGDQTSSVASHKSVVTNIITSTLDLNKLDPSLLSAFDEDEIAPTSVGIGRPTESFAINSIIDLVKNKDVIESVEIDKSYSSQTPTPSLGDDIIASIKPDTVKTYYTTYTFFTTIYVGSDANVCSRREVYTNYVGPDELIPTKTNPLSAESTKAQFDFRNCKQVKGMSSQIIDDNSSVESSISMEQNRLEEKETTPQPTPIEVDMLFSVESNPLSENSFVTDVKSSSSKGESKYLDNNNVLDDQISSESNIDEILPSPTLLLQTSYTTFTYFTTMYIGKDSSKVKSRLETITNVVTETITPKTEPEEENNLPITYYTTFTYWTTLYKDKSTTITSREEIVSNVVTPTAQSIPTVSPIDTSPIDIVSVLPPKDLEVELKPSLVDSSLEKDDGKATFFTTYTYFTTFYAGNTSIIRSSLETVTNIVDNTKLVEDNQLGRKVASGSIDKNLIQDIEGKPQIIPTKVKEEIVATKLPDPSNVSSTVLQGTYIDNLFAEVKPVDNTTPSSDTEKKILFSQVAVISGDSTVVTGDNKTLGEGTNTTTLTSNTTTTTEGSAISPTPEVIQSSVAEPETTTETLLEEDVEEDDPNSKKKGRLTFSTKKPSFTPVIIPFASRNRPTFSPKRLPVPNSATTITRADFTPTITATPTLKSVRPTGSFNGNRKAAASPGSLSPGRRFSGRSSASINLSANIPASRAGGFPRGSISPTSRRTGFRSSTLRSNSLDYASRSAIPRIRPTASSRLRGSRQSASVSYTPADEFETFATQQEETATESLDEINDFSNRQTTNNPLLRFRRPPVARQPGTAILPRSTTPSSRRSQTSRGRTTTTKRSTTSRSTTNPLLSLRRQRPSNALFPRRNLFKQPEPEPVEQIVENEPKEEESEELLDEEEFEEDNDYESSDRKEQQVATPSTPSIRKNSNTVQIRPFAFKRRTKRQVDYGNRKFTNFRRPGVKPASTRRPEPEPETEPPAPPPPKQKPGRYNSRPSVNSRSTTASAPKVSQRQPFIIRGESRSTTTSSPPYRRGKIRTSSRTTTLSSRPKAPRLTGKSAQSLRSSKTTQSSRPTSRSRSRTTTSRASSRQRNSFENLSGERFNKYDNILNDGKITITHQIPIEVTIPVVNGKITEYKNVLTAKASIETLLLNQVSTSVGPIGNQQLVLALESTELGENGATKITKFVLHETPTTTVIFTPTTIRGRKTSYSHVLPSTVYNVEPVVQTVAPEINANVPLANLLLSQLLLGNQQPGINPLLALQGQGLIPQQPVVQTPVTELKTRTTTYVTTVTDNRETVLTITFRATPIETTIVNPTTDVITATEYITETVVTTPTVLAQPAFNTNAIVYDNSPWRPGREIDMEQRSAEDERKIKNLATRIMSNGVEVLVRDKSAEGKQEQRKLKLMHLASMKPSNNGVSLTPPFKSLLSSAVATVVNRQEMSAFFPLHHLMQHNYIIKTCMTTYTYLTTVVQNKRSAVSTFETIVSVVTTESLTNLYATDVLADIKPSKTKYMEVKTIQPSAANMYLNNNPKLDKRIDNEEHNFDLIQPSEISHPSCTTSCTCNHAKTETLKTKYSNIKQSSSPTSDKYHTKNTKYNGPKLDVRPTHKEILNKTQYRPYEYEISTQAAPTDKIVEKYTQVTDYLDDKDTNSVEASDLLTNEQAPPMPPPKTNKAPMNLTSQKVKPDRPPKVDKNKFVMAELIKLGSLGIKGLSQLAPVIEKMTGGFIKRQEPIKTTTTTTTTTVKPVTKITSYSANKRVDSDVDSKHGNFPIYIPVDEMETSETQVAFTNATLHQNFAWAAEHNLRGNFVKPKIVHESPLVNGGIPISPGEIITANSDVIVGKPAVGGPLTLAASGIKLQNPVHPPPIDSIAANNEHYIVKEKPPPRQSVSTTHADDSFDLRPPELPKLKSKPNKNSHRPLETYFDQQISHVTSSRMPVMTHLNNDPNKYAGLKKNNGPVFVNHGRPAFLDFIPSLNKPVNTSPIDHSVNQRPDLDINKDNDIPDNNPSSSEIVSTKILTDDKYQIVESPDNINRPFLVDIQPSKVANVLIPHGSSTAIVFAGSSEPHKTGDYVDDPLPYPEPGYFGSFSIDAPHMTNVHNVVPTNNNLFIVKPNGQATTDGFKNKMPTYQDILTSKEHKFKFSENKRPKDLNKLPPPTSSQASHIQVGPKITVYNPEQYKGEFEKHRQSTLSNKHNEEKEVIDKEYENYLAVPPPPPKRHFNQENRYDKNKAYHHQLPVIHTKPVQDSKVFLNVQHPVSNQLPPKVTSEIYFASQFPNSQPTPTYTFKIPQSPTNGNAYSQLPKINSQAHKTGTSNHVSNSYIVSTSNAADPSIIGNNREENTYTVTMNTAANVASDGKPGHVMGSSITVPITTTSHNGQINANIPIGTNFAIRVEDDPAKYESVALHGKRHPSLNHNEHVHIPFNNINNFNVDSSSSKLNSSQSMTKIQNNGKDKHVNNEIYPFITSSINSHANFPMMNEEVHLHTNSNPVINYDSNKHIVKQDRIPQLKPNISTNSHGWYSSILNEGNVKNIDVESTTRKNIPLNYDINNDSVPEFGEKIATVGKPPAEFWNQNNKQSVNNFGVGKPFSKSKEDRTPNVSVFTIRPNYIPSIYGVQQPTYDIPVRDNSEETTTIKTIYQGPQNSIKPVYETAEEIYDGEEEPETVGDGEVSSESMSVPYVSSSNERKNSTEESVLGTVSQNNNPLKMDSNNKSVQLVNFNPGTQTEKPFTSYNKTSFQSNSMKPVNDNLNIYMKPRPFTIQTAIPLDNQLQQPHWQINQLMENVTNNMSYEDNFELNAGEEIKTTSTSKPRYTNKPYLRPAKPDSGNKTHSRPRDPVLLNSTRIVNESNIITSTVHIKDKKPLTIEIDEKSTLTSFTISPQTEFNSTSSEILNLSPPPPHVDQNYKLSKFDEIMGMSPPPPRTQSPRYPLRVTQTPRPVLPIRTPPPYRTLPPRTSTPRQSTTRPPRKPVSKDEVSTYRPIYEITNKIKRPSYNFDQPSSLLLPPPRELPSKNIQTENIPRQTSVLSPTTSVIFPTPLSSSWLTSSNIGFSSSFNFAPTSVYFPETVSQYQDKPDMMSSHDSSENIDNSYEYELSSETSDVSYENPVTEKKVTFVKQMNRTQPSKNVNKVSGAHFNDGSFLSSESSQEDLTKNKVKVTPMGNKNRTRKPYPIHNDDKKSSISKFKLPSKPVLIIKPSRTLSRPEVSYPPRISTIKKIKPLPSRPLAIFPSSIIESSESNMEEDFIRPTEVLKDIEVPTIPPEVTSVIEKTITSTLTISKDIIDANIKPTHHAGNEIKISDEIVPTKTEFRTTIITLTKTLSEPPQTVSSIGYVNLTHTLTVTHTETSLISKSEGAVTQTLVLTNTHTSTIVDVVTEIYTEVQPTTIVETVTKHIPIQQVEATPVMPSATNTNTKIALDDIAMSSEESDNFIIRDNDVTENIQKIEEEKDNDTFFVVMNKSQNGGKVTPINTDVETGEYDGVTRNEQVNNNGVSQVLFGEILLAGTPYLETINVARPTVTGYGKECQPDCKASRNERCQRIDGIMKCVCRPGFARMFPDRPCKPTYTYSVRLALGSQGNERLKFQKNLSDNSSKEYHTLAVATHEGINRMIMQSDLRDVYHGVHITGFHPVDMRTPKGELYEGVINDFYVQLSDNAHESRLKEVIEKYLRNNNYSLGGTEVHAADQLMDRLNVSDFDECVSTQFHDCSEHARCFNLRGTYTCSCLEGFADLSVNTLYPGRICSSDAVGCGGCNYHGTCFERESAMFCECFKWYAGRTCQVNLKAVLITVTVIGAVVILVVTIWASKRCCCQRGPATQTFVIGCMQGMPSLHQGNLPSKQRADRRALIAEREAAETCSVQNTSLPYIPSKQSRSRSQCSKKCVISDPPAHAPPPPPAPALMIPRARLHPQHSDSRDNLARKKSAEIISEAKLISYLESGATNVTEEMRRKHSVESSYSVNKERPNKGALVSAGFKVSTTVRPDENSIKEDRDDASSVNKTDLEAEMSHFDTLRKYSNSQEDMSEWTDAERRIGELTLSEARSVGGTLPASTGRAASSTRLTHQEAHTMAERDLGSTFLLPHVHLYKPDLTSDVSEFDSL